MGGGVHVGILSYVWYGKTRMVWLPDGEKKFDMFSCFDTIPACDKQTDRYTSCDSTVNAMHSIVGNENG